MDNDPIDFHDVVKSFKWRRAMDVEIDVIQRNNTWELIDLPIGKNNRSQMDFQNKN